MFKFIFEACGMDERYSDTTLVDLYNWDWEAHNVIYWWWEFHHNYTALAMSMHPRLGADSGLRALSSELLQVVARFM